MSSRGRCFVSRVFLFLRRWFFVRRLCLFALLADLSLGKPQKRTIAKCELLPDLLVIKRSNEQFVVWADCS